MGDRIEKIKKGFNNFRTTRVWSDFGESVDVDDVAFLLVEIERLTKENIRHELRYKMLEDKWKKENLGLLQENAGLQEYSTSRDESIKVYRQEIKELKEKLNKFAEDCFVLTGKLQEVEEEIM